MTLTQRLKRARALLAKSWSGPNASPLWEAWTASAVPCSWRDEGAAAFSVEGALRVIAGRDDITEEWDTLESTFGAEVPSDLRFWLMDPGITLASVLALFDRAILRLGRNA